MYQWMIAAPKSGSGKTAAVCGLLSLLKKKGLAAGAFKCGPDFIDPMFHRKILGTPSFNLDSFFLEQAELRALYQRETASCEAAVVEGVMGYFDGVGMTAWGSSWDVARILNLPVILVVDGRGASLSVLAQIKGFLDFCPEVERKNAGGGQENCQAPHQPVRRPTSSIAGVILNRTSPSMCGLLKERIEQELGIACLGCIPTLSWLDLKSRHLGLWLPDEIENLKEQMEKLAQAMEESLDIERLLELGEAGKRMADGEKQPVETNPPGVEKWPCQISPPAFTLAVARDQAFCFYYEENLELMKSLGARILPFSPLSDEKIPEEADGILLGGGYPERFAGELSGNRSMRESIRQAAERGLPMLAECGGYLYLLQELEGEDGRMYPMAGVFSGEGKREKRLRHFGYVTVESGADSPYLKQNQQIRGHEFHYWHCRMDDEEGVMEAKKPLGGKCWPAMRVKNQVMAGFPHLYYPSCQEAAQAFAAACRRFGRGRM